MTPDLMTWVALRIDEDEGRDEAVGLYVLAALNGPQSREGYLTSGTPPDAPKPVDAGVVETPALRGLTLEVTA